jgi:hypothetical protein
MASTEKLLEEIQRKYEYNVNSIGKQLQQLGEDKNILIHELKMGTFDPVLPYFNFFGGMRSMYCYLPLDKALFLKVIKGMEENGWKAGALTVDENNASVTLKYKNPSDADPKELVTYMNAYGQGVNCRIVELQPKQQYDPGVYEWVCEAGAEELNLANNKGIQE